MAEGIYKITEDFESALCRYTGAPYAIALDNGSNALFLALKYSTPKGTEVGIPSHTYPSVPCEIIHAGCKVKFYDSDKVLTGAYRLRGTQVVDSALRFSCGMYEANTFMCLSFTGPYKTLKLSKGGAILTDNKIAYDWFKRKRFSGRRELDYHVDYIDEIGWNFYMMPEIATRGLLLMRQFYDVDGNPINMPDGTRPYPDLSKFKIYTDETRG